MSVVLQPAADS